MDWQTLDLCDVPSSPGVYGFKQGDRWLYIGQSGDLKRRLNKQHIPLQIALEMDDLALLYYLTNSPRRLEKSVIRKLQPEWNGGTSFEEFGDGYACKSRISLVSEEEMLTAIKSLKF